MAIRTEREDFSPETVRSELEAGTSISFVEEFALFAQSDAGNVDEIGQKNAVFPDTQGVILATQPRPDDDAETGPINPLRQYLKDIHHPILSYESQQILFRMAPVGERGNFPIQEVIEHDQFSEVVSHFSEKDQERFYELVGESETLGQLLQRMNLRLSPNVAKRYYNSGLDRLDLIQEGNVGIMTAVEKFDPDKPANPNDPNGKKVEFSTYAFWWIKQSISRSIYDQGQTIRFPVHAGEALRKTGKIARAYEVDKGSSPTSKQLEDLLRTEYGYSDEKAAFLANEYVNGFRSRPMSIDIPLGEDRSMTLAEFIPAPSDDIDEYLESRTSNESDNRVQEIMKHLDPRERMVVMMRLGMVDGKVYSLAEVGESLGLTRERVRQIQMKGMEKLRQGDAFKALRHSFNETRGETEIQEERSDKKLAPPQHSRTIHKNEPVIAKGWLKQ